VSESFLRKLAPDIAASLVQRGRDIKSRERIQREKTRFDGYWQSFEELRLENVYPARAKVTDRMYRHTGTKLKFVESTDFHRRRAI
jgi:polynucleotide 5'-kinase involved in rRNA processing